MRLRTFSLGGNLFSTKYFYILQNCFRITLRKLYSIIKIPKFEAFQSSANDQQSTTDFEEIATVQWQEKMFSKTERAYYCQKENCKTELEKKYYQMIKELPVNEDSGTIFTYTHDDNYQAPDNFGPRDVKITKLRKNVEARKANEEDLTKLFVNPNQVEVPSRYAIGDEFTNMFIMADLEPTTVLISIFYRKSDGLLIIFPDFNEQENAYHLEIDQNSKQLFVYFVENISATSNETTKQLAQTEKLNKIQEETCALMRKLSICKDDGFVYPKFCRIVLMLEIIDGQHFEYDNIHVQFNIILPNFIKLVEGKLAGATHSSFKNEHHFWNFGYCHSLVLDIDDEFLLSTSKLDSITINFEAISIDPLWERERREGISSLKIPLEGKRDVEVLELSCFRDLQGGSVWRDFLERFFLGGIHKTKMFDHCQGGVVNLYGNKTISTGVLRVKIQKITQMKPLKRNFLHLKSIDEIISSYHQAKANLAN